MEFFLIIISAIFVNNIMLSQFLGTCPFLGVSGKISTATGMAGAVCFVITLATLVTYLINKYLLVAFSLEFLQTIAFILVIAALVQMVEIVLKKISPSLYQALGIFLPLITTNCAVLGVALNVCTKEFTFGSARPQSWGVYGLCLGYRHRLRHGPDTLRRPQGTSGTELGSEGFQRSADRSCDLRNPCDGIHGILRYGLIFAASASPEDDRDM